jgi:hypothetical protein
MVMNTPPMIVCRDAGSFSTTNARIMEITTLNLSMGTTLDA